MSKRFLTAGELAALDKWYVIDATDQVLGRVATKAATILSGKHRPQYAPVLVSGDHVIIVNADKIKLTGEKLDKKVYRWHTLYPGGLREIAARKLFETNKPERVIREAVLGDDFRRDATTEEISRMRELVRHGMAAGALGLSDDECCGIQHRPELLGLRGERR